MVNPEGLFKAIIYSFLLIILLIILIPVIIIPLFQGKYMRLSSIGHSEPLQDFMESYIRNLIINIVKFKDQDKNIKDLIDEGIIPSKTDTYFKTDPESMPLWYMYFCFQKAVLKKNKREVAIWKNIFGEDLKSFYVNSKKIDLYTESGESISDESMKFLKEKIEKIKNVLDSFEKKKDADVVKEMSIRETKLMNSYFKSIYRSYETRKVGGIANVKLFTIYMEEYVLYVFVEKIAKELWAKYHVNSLEMATNIYDFIAGPAATDYMSKISMKIAGVSDDEYSEYKQGMEQTQIEAQQKSDAQQEEAEPQQEEAAPQANNESFINNPIIETFGNPLAALKSIGDFFTNLASTAVAIAEVAANPIGILKILIGLIIGLMLYFMWYIICVIFGVASSHVIAFVYYAFESAFLTVIWVIIFIFYGLIYAILMIIDFTTGGLIMAALRCENLPDLWHKGYNFAHGNAFGLKLFCTRPCSSRYKPIGLMCKRLKNYEPGKCPQAHIYNLYLESNKKTDSALLSGPKIHQYKPDLKYFTSSQREKMALISDSFENKLEFNRLCNKKMKKYDYINQYICENIDKLIHDEDDKKEMSKICNVAYCEFNFTEDNSISLNKNDNKFPFCKTNVKSEENAKVIETSKKNVYILVFTMLFYGIIGIIIFKILFDMLNVSLDEENKLFDMLANNF